MKEIFNKIKSVFGASMRVRNRGKSKAQSMVEFALLLPILLILFTGMVEFGFVLNTYLSLLDATRQAARVYSNVTPFDLETDTSTDPPTINKVDDLTYYPAVANLVVDTLNSNSYQIIYDSTLDNVIVSVIGVRVDDPDTDPPTLSIFRHPSGSDYYMLNPGGAHSRYYDESGGDPDVLIKDYMNQHDTPLSAGLLVVELYYSYEGTTKMPWLQMFASDADPLMLYASSIMPLGSAKPDEATATP